MNEQWKKLLEESRNNYLSVVQSFSKMQKEVEKIMIYTTENGMTYQKDLTKILSDWVEVGNTIRDDLQKMMEQNLKTTFDNVSMELPFKKEMDSLYSNIQESFKKYFENLQSISFVNKK